MFADKSGLLTLHYGKHHITLVDEIKLWFLDESFTDVIIVCDDDDDEEDEEEERQPEKPESSREEEKEENQEKGEFFNGRFKKKSPRGFALHHFSTVISQSNSLITMQRNRIRKIVRFRRNVRTLPLMFLPVHRQRIQVCFSMVVSDTQQHDDEDKEKISDVTEKKEDEQESNGKTDQIKQEEEGPKESENKEEISTNKTECDKERDLSRKKVKKSKILLKAHRLILASCSPLIRKILDNNVNNSMDNLTIYFPGEKPTSKFR